MAVCEAMAIGLPVVAGRSAGGIPWLVGKEGADGLTDVTNVDSIVSTLAHLLLNRDAWTKVSSSGRNRIADLCNPESVAARFEGFYHEAVNAWTSRGASLCTHGGDSR
jgi:glycosyltransferase involved in cell wall biosynthesis